MNKYCYRVIFSKTQQRFIVVSELAKVDGKAKTENTTSINSVSKTFEKMTALLGQGSYLFKPLSFALYCALGFVSLIPQVQAENAPLIIKADSTANANERPHVIETANGIPQVNIQTPNPKGLSYNRYSQFDVDNKGAILNNSRQHTQTQLGGWVQANPYLAGSEAKVIVNEVNSNKPSQLKGYVEVAGQRADVIIANPSGLHCEGCGIINADRVSLTTGKPQLNGGSLESFVVEKGKVSVSGKGLDNSQSNYTDIIAKEVKVNAGVWSKKAINVTTGHNKVSKNNDSVQIINSKSNTTNTDDTHYSVDVANLGGMYAEKIHIIGTESGLGVRNLGHLGASAGDIVIDVNGKVVNSNNIQAKQNITINAKRDIANKGVIYSQKGNITLKSAEKNIKQLGTVTARDSSQKNGNIELVAKQKITQKGETLATGNVTYKANILQTDKSALIGAGLKFTQTQTGENKELLKADKKGKILDVTVKEKAIIQGQNLAQNKISVKSKEIDLSESNNKSDHIDLNAENNVISKQAKLSASSSININANKLVNEEGNIVASNVVINTTAVNNTKGSISALEKLTGNIISTFDNTQGQLLSLGDIAIKGKGVLLNNQSGTIASNNNLLIDVKTLENESHIQSNNANIHLQDSFTLNNAFKISKNLNLSTKGNFINNSTLRTGEGLTIQAKHIENKNQAELSSKNTNIASRTLVNRGLIDASQTVIKTSYLDNLGTGRIYGDHIAIEAKQLNNREETQNAETKSAVIASRERLDLAVGHLLNYDGGSLISLGNMYFGKTLDDKKHSTGNSDLVENSNGLIEAQGDIYFNVNKVKNIHKYLKTEIKEISRTPIYEYRASGDSKRYLNGTQGLSVEREDNESGGFLGSDAKVRDLYFLRLPDGSKHYYWLEYDYTRSIKETQVLKPLYNEGRILSGGNIYFGSADVENQDSKIISGRTIHFDNVNSLDNKETKGIQITTDSGKVYNKRKGRKCVKKILGKCVDHADTTKTDIWDYNPPEIHKSISLGLWQYAENAKAELANVRDPNASKINDRKVVGSNGDIGKLPTISEISLPNSNLYKVNPDANSHYLIETDPRFTDRNKWLSSDYMFNQLRSDHQLVQKRLGDGYYEQRLVNEQINQLTGRRFLENYQSDFEQYKALMDSGIYYAKKFNLIPGVALTAEQMKELTTDLVWFVTKKVKLPNGKEVQVLAPEVYLSSRNIKVNNKGALISGNQIIATVTGEIKNSGTISGKKITALSANNIHNNSGSIEGERVYLKAEDALTNIGGDLLAKKELIAQVGRIDIQSTIAETVDTGDFYRKEINEQAKIKVGNNGNLVLFAKEDITLKGVDIDNKGSTNINAGNALSLSSIALKNKENFDFSEGNYVYLEQTKQIGNRLNLIGDTKLVGQKAITLAGDSIHSDSNLLLASSGDITVKETRETENIAFGARDKTKGLLSKTETIVKHKHDYDLAKGTQIDANKILIHSSQGDVNIQGSQIVAENDLAIQGKNITIKEAENRAYSEDFEQTRQSGLLTGGGKIGFTIGSRKETTESDKTKYYAKGSQVGSLQDNVNIIAENNYTQQASIVTSAKKDVNIKAKQVNIEAPSDRYETHFKHTFEQKGLSIALTGIVADVVQGAQGLAETAKTVGQSKDDRINALGAVNTGFDAYRNYQNLKKLQDFAKGLSNGEIAKGTSVGVAITYGEQKNVQMTETSGNIAARSAVNAGGKVNIQAVGDNEKSTINIIGSDVLGKGGTNLEAQGDINIVAAEQTHKERSKNKSSGFNAGVAVDFGSNGMSFGITAGGNYGKGYGNGDEKTYAYSHVGDKNSVTQITSGGDVNLKGGQVRGTKVNLEAENLNIESLQETMGYQGKQMNVSGQVTVGYGVSGSASYNQSKMNADYASVVEQSGIYAGDEGYDINVNQHTDLKGGIVTSSAKAEAENKNRFSTETLSHSDIENKANYSGNSIGVSGGFAMNADLGLGDKAAAQSNKQAVNEEGQPLYTDSQGKKTTDAKGADGKANTAVLATGKSSLTKDIGVGIGHDKESQSSLTNSGINTKNIEIRNEDKQLSQTGKTADETIKSVKTELTLENAEAHSGKLAQNFNKEKVLKELNIQVKVTKDFRKNAFSSINNYVLPRQAELRAKIKTAKTEEEKTAIYKEIYKLQYQKRLLETVVGVVAGSPDVAITQGTLQLANTKMREETLANSRKFKGIVEVTTGKVLRNDSYDSGYFDGVKLGGVRIDVNAICGNKEIGSCSTRPDGSVVFHGEGSRTLADAINPEKNKLVIDSYGATGGFQPVEGGWYFNGKPLMQYKKGGFSDLLVESFAGPHDLLGGQIWGWYDKQGNTSQKNGLESKASGVTTVVAIPVTAPIALSDLISSDFMEVLYKLGGN